MRDIYFPLIRILSKDGNSANRDSMVFYILRCSDDSYYVGYTDSLEIRIAAHQ